MPDFDPTAEAFRNSISSAQANVQDSMDYDPDKAARAYQLSQVTGIPPQFIFNDGDVDEFDNRRRQAAAKEMVRSNPYISDYINSHPMAAKISNDDLGNLDDITEKMQDYHGTERSSAPGAFVRNAAKGVLPMVGSLPAMGAGADIGAAIGTVVGGPGLGTIAGAVVGGGIGGIGGSYGISLIQDWLLSKLPSSFVKSIGMDPEQARMDLAEHGTASFLGGLAPFALAMTPGVAVRELPAGATALERVLNKPIAQRAINAAAMGGFEAAQETYQGQLVPEHIGEAAAFGAVFAKPTAFGEGAITVGQRFAARVTPWLRSGKEPPVGVDPISDQILKAEAEDRMKRFDALYESVTKSTTRERDANFFKQQFLKQFPDATVEIDAQAIRKLYGESQPEPNDNKLGWIPDINEQLDMAEAAGGRVTASIHDWLAHAPKEVKDELHDFIATKRGGMTIEDTKALPGIEEADKPREPNAKVNELLRQVGIEPEPTSDPAVDGVRRAAGLNFSDAVASAMIEETPDEVLRQAIPLEAPAPEGKLIDFGVGVRALVRPRREYSDIERELVDATQGELERIAPSAIGLDVHDIIKDDGKSVWGMYIRYSDRLPVILYSLTADNPIGVGWHEAIHHLRQYGFFSDDEWRTLTATAERQGWMEKHGIGRTRYKDATHEQKIEEAVAEEFRTWMESRQEFPVSAWGRIMEKLRHMVDFVGDQVRKLLGKPMAFDQLFEKVEAGEIGRREPRPPEGGFPIERAAMEKQPELPQAGTTRMEDRPPVKGFPGLTAKQVKQWLVNISRGEKEAAEALTSRRLKEQNRTQSIEWKNNEKAMRAEIEVTVNNRPDIAVDTLLRTGVMDGTKLKQRPKLAAGSLTTAEKAMLPKEYITERGGWHIDDMATMYGYTSGEAMVHRLAAFNDAIKESKMRPKDYINKIIDDETRQHMEARYGDLDTNIINETKDQVISETVEDKLHQNTMYLANKAGLEYTITKAQLKAAVVEDMKHQINSQTDSDAYIADAGRAGRAMEEAATKEDWAEGWRQSQAQQLALLRAKEALKVEKTKAQLEKRLKKFTSQRIVAGVEPEYTNFIQLAALRFGRGLRRSVQDLQKEIEKGTYKTFNDFVAAKEDPERDRRDLHVPEFMLDPDFNKRIEDLTNEELGQVHNAFKALEHNGRDELKAIREGDKADLAELIGEMVAKIKSLGAPKTYRIDKPPGAFRMVTDHAKNFWWSGINVESMLNRIDRNDPHGVFYQTITRIFTEGNNSKEAMLKEYQEKLNKIGDIADLDKLVDNQIFIDPIDGKAFPMRKRNVLGILQNVGNASNLQKLAEGYGLKPEDIMNFLKAHTTKEDWDRAQSIGNLFKELFAKADDMSRQISGVGIEGLELEPIQTPFGTYDGWYNPVKYDPLRPGTSKRLLGPAADAETGFYRATTPQGYTKGRTGYIAPMELNLDIVPIRMRQMIHDINMRPVVQQLSKFFYSPQLKSAMISYFGKHQAETLIPFLRDIANSANFKSMSESMGGQALEYFRQNTIATLIGLNPSTVLKHGPTALINSLTEVGPINWMREFMTLVGHDEESNKTNWRMAMDKSEELQRRLRRNFTELIEGHGRELTLSRSSFRDFMVTAGATPVSISDLLSAVPTWLAEYKKHIAAGESEGFAIDQGNRAVRRAHGSSSITNKPAIMRQGGPLMQTFASLYGFFSHMQQRQYEMAWKAKDLLRDVVGKGSGDAEMATRHAPDLLKGFMSYIIFPALVEEIVTPYTNKEKESWAMKAAKVLTTGLSSSLIGVRDFERALINHNDPQAGLIGTSMKAASDLTRDLTGKHPLSRDHAGNIIKHTASLVGVLTGLTNSQEGRSMEYLYRYNQGLEHPKGPWSNLVGLRYGKIGKHSKTFDDWMKEMTK